MYSQELKSTAFRLSELSELMLQEASKRESEKEKLIEELVMPLLKEYDKNYEQLENEYQKLNILYSDGITQRYNYSEFDTDVIGKAIASLLTQVNNNPYVYFTPKLLCYGTPKYDCFGDLVEEAPLYKVPFKMIIRKPFLSLLGKEFDKTRFENFLSLDETVIILDRNDRNYLLSKSLYLYKICNNTLSLNLNQPFPKNGRFVHGFEMPKIPEEQYNIINEFVDVLVDYRIENKLNEISEEEINALLEDYVDSIKDENLTTSKYFKQKVKSIK